MSSAAPVTLFNLAGLAGHAAEPHIQPGNHLRVGHHPLLGLPVAPFILQRATSGPGLPDGVDLRRDILFRDGADRVLTLPITVRKGDVIRATIIQGAGLTSILVGMVSRALSDSDDTPTPTDLPPTDGLPGRRLLVAASDVQTGRAATSQGKLTMRAFSTSASSGPVVVGERASAPYIIAAPAIAEVEVTGSGVITDMVWLAAQDIVDLKWETIDLLHLPHDGGPRYLSVTGAVPRAMDQVKTQGPKRRPLQDVTGAASPAASPPMTPPDEQDRVESLAAPLGIDLAALIDGPQPPLTASETVAVTDANGASLAPTSGEESSVTISHLSRVLQGTIDPGVAAWLGYKGLDPSFGGDDGISFYRVLGFFADPASIGATPTEVTELPLALVPLADRQLSGSEVQRLVAGFAANVLQRENRMLTGNLRGLSGPFMLLAAHAAIDSRAVPEPPPRPRMDVPAHAGWLPATPPAAVRSIDCALAGVLVGATLAATREQPMPGGFVRLNRLCSNGRWHLPMVLGMTQANDGQPLVISGPWQGTISDRTAGAGPARYHIAQQDRFGRWSETANRDAPAGPRPKPPRPVLQGSYQQPALADAATTGGTFLLHVPLPEPESLAPGSHMLSHVRLRFAHHNVATPALTVAMPDVAALVSTAIVTDTTTPAAQLPRRAVPATVTGPVLQPTEQRNMVIDAIWIDSVGQESVPSEPLQLTMTDPRPPVQMPIADVLLYSSRPDATGLAWIERSWPLPGGPPPSYAVYYTDEVRLLAWLRANSRTAEAISISAITDRAARAGRLRTIQADFPDDQFERLPGAVDTTAATKRSFRHAVSGSSRVLQAYKIAVEAPGSGARPVLSGLDMVFYGVPNSDPPPRPSVTVKLVAPMAGDPALVAEVTVTLEPGVTRGALARLYRTRGGPASPLTAPVVNLLPLSAPDAVTGQQVVKFRDTGTAQIAPTARLTAFSRYQWFAEVQGAPESGASVPGLWSLPSDPVGLATVPVSPPAPPVLDGFGGTAATGGQDNLTLRLSHPFGLRPTPIGRWRYRVLRAPAGGDWALMAEGEAVEATLEVPDLVTGGFTPTATQFRVTLYDPIGRATPDLTVVTS